MITKHCMIYDLLHILVKIQIGIYNKPNSKNETCDRHFLLESFKIYVSLHSIIKSIYFQRKAKVFLILLKKT